MPAERGKQEVSAVNEKAMKELASLRFFAEDKTPDKVQAGMMIGFLFFLLSGRVFSAAQLKLPRAGRSPRDSP